MTYNYGTSAFECSGVLHVLFNVTVHLLELILNYLFIVLKA